MRRHVEQRASQHCSEQADFTSVRMCIPRSVTVYVCACLYELMYTWTKIKIVHSRNRAARTRKAVQSGARQGKTVAAAVVFFVLVGSVLEQVGLGSVRCGRKRKRKGVLRKRRK